MGFSLLLKKTPDVHLPAWRENGLNQDDLISLSKSSTTPKHTMHFRNRISSFFSSPQIQYRTYRMLMLKPSN